MGWANEWVSFDTETTGFGPKARILEIGVVTFAEGKVVREWSSFFCPSDLDWDAPKVKEALAINKLTREMLNGAPTFEQVVPDLLVELSNSPHWVAHNAEFDMDMLGNEFGRIGKPRPTPKLLICTKNLGNRLNNNQPPNRLENVAQRFGIPQDGAHRAVVDARTCGLILAEMHRRALLPTDDAAMATLCQETAAQWRGRYNR